MHGRRHQRGFFHLSLMLPKIESEQPPEVASEQPPAEEDCSCLLFLLKRRESSALCLQEHMEEPKQDHAQPPHDPFRHGAILQASGFVSSAFRSCSPLRLCAQCRRVRRPSQDFDLFLVASGIHWSLLQAPWSKKRPREDEDVAIPDSRAAKSEIWCQVS